MASADVPLPPAPLPVAPPPPPPAPPSAAPPSRDVYSRSRYRFTSGLRAGEVARIRDADGQPLLTYRSFASVVGIVAALVTGIVTVAGAAAVLFLIAEGSPLRAVAALVLTAIFAFFIALLVPRVQVTLYEHDQPAMTIAQTSVFPLARYVVVMPNGGTLVTLQKSVLARLGRNRWTIHDGSRFLGQAVEESFRRALVRKLLGKFNRRYESDLRIELSGLDAGRIIRRGAEADTLEVRGDADRRVLLALATLVLGSEP